MPRAFTPSRSMIYGSPQRQALVETGDIVMGALRGWGSDMIQSEYRRQVSNAGIAMEKERQNLATFMREHQNDPASWRTKLAQERERIRKSILGPLTMPKAKETAEIEFDEEFQRWEGQIEENAFKQSAINTNADFRTGNKTLGAPREYGDETDVREHLTAWHTHIEGGWNGGDKPVDDLPNQEVVDLMKRQASQQVIGNYLTQQALATGREDIFDRANEFAANITGEQEPLFGTEELAQVKSHYRQLAHADQLETERQQQALVDKASTGLWKIAQQNDFTPKAAIEYINTLPDSVPLKDKRELLWLTTNVKELLADGKANPLQTRQDYVAYKELLYGAQDHSKTKEDFRKAVNKGQITLADYEHLLKVAEEDGAAVTEARRLTNTLKSVDDLLEAKFSANADMVATAKVKAHRLLEASMKAAADAGRPLTGDDLLIEALHIEREIEGETALTPEEMLPLPPRRVLAEPRKAGDPLTNATGVQIGTYTQDNKVELTLDGMRQLVRIARKKGWTEQQALDWARRNGFVVE